MFVKQSIGGAARQENQQVASGSGDIALDIENLPCANGPFGNPQAKPCRWDSVPLTRKVVHIQPDKQDVVWELQKEKSMAFIVRKNVLQ